MTPQPDTIPSNLSWSQINSREYQLRGEGRVLATLKKDDDRDASMTGEGETRKWTFKRMGLFRFSVSVLAECECMHCATLVDSRAGKCAGLCGRSRLVKSRPACASRLVYFRMQVPR